MGISWVMNDSLLMVGGFYRGSLQQPNWLEMIWDFFQWPIVNQVRSTLRDYISGLEPCSQWLLVVEPCWTKPLEPGKPSELIKKKTPGDLVWLCQLRISRSSLLVLLRCKSRLGHWEPCLKLSISDDFCTFRGYFAVILYIWKPLVFFTFFPWFFVNLLGISP